MFDESYIKEKIDIIFNVEINNILRKRSFHYIEKSDFSVSDPSKPLIKGIVEPLMDLQLRKSDNFYLQWPTYDTLKKLYNMISTDTQSREIFISILKEKLLNGESILLLDEWHDYASLAFYFLIKIGKNNQSVEVLKFIENNKKKYPKGRAGLFEAIFKFMHLEPEYFDDTTLVILKKINYQHNYSPNQQINKYMFDQKINEIRYDKLQNELTGANEELNIDKEKVIEIIAKYNFPSKMEEFLLQIDLIPESDEWDSINSGMIGNLRSFYEELIRNIAESIKAKVGDEFPKDSKKSEIGNKRVYIKNNLNLTDVDDKLIDSYVNILHKEGGHSFISEKRYYRLTKNIGIEIAYFLMSKLEAFLEE